MYIALRSVLNFNIIVIRDKLKIITNRDDVRANIVKANGLRIIIDVEVDKIEFIKNIFRQTWLESKLSKMVFDDVLLSVCKFFPTSSNYLNLKATLYKVQNFQNQKKCLCFLLIFTFHLLLQKVGISKSKNKYFN